MLAIFYKIRVSNPFTFMIDWPFRMKHWLRGFVPKVVELLCMSETWNGMEGLYAFGQARAIGVSNFSTKKL
ncbi:NADPH-dependent aldo-keto reductase, chloroplastic, partial [Cucurbita argyrosperma subsp. argyrosperma]